MKLKGISDLTNLITRAGKNNGVSVKLEWFLFVTDRLRLFSN